MFDTHCHLFDKRFETNLDSVIIKSRQSGVKYFLIPAVSIETSKAGVRLNAAYQDVYSAVGVHPTEKLMLENISEVEKILDELCLDKKVLALGETGLDYYHFESSPDVQKEFLKMHIKLALKHEKALILHNRQSTNDLLNLLNENWQDVLLGKIVFHCCSFEPEIVDFAKKYDCYMGVDGDITYDGFKQKMVKSVGIEKLVLETDTPYLLPEPLKGQKLYPNTPENLHFIADYLSNILGLEKSNLINITTENAKRLFSVH